MTSIKIFLEKQKNHCFCHYHTTGTAVVKQKFLKSKKYFEKMIAIRRNYGIM